MQPRTFLKLWNLFFVLVIVFGFTTASAAVYTVSNTNDSGIGSLRQAITDANANMPGPHTINCTATGTITLLSSMPIIISAITVNGPVAGTLEISKPTTGGNAFSASTTVKPPMVLNDLTFKNFNSTFYVVRNTGGLTMNRCVFKNNNSCWLVGIEHNSILNNCSFSFNTSCISIFFTATGSLYSFSNNLNQCTFNNNVILNGSATGILNFGSKMILTNCTFANNSSLNGTCISLQATSNGKSSAINCTFYGNVATSSPGGAIYVVPARSLSLENCILVGNTSGGTGPEMEGIDSSANGHNIIGNTSGITFKGSVAGNITGVSASSVINTTLANNGGITQTLALIAGSPAINSAFNTIAPPADQRSYARIGNPDRGAYEFGSSGPLPVTLVSFDGKFTGNKVELTWTTLCETNSDYFLIERSIDGDKWEPAIKIKTNGNNCGLKNYSYSDFDFTSGLNYYKLSQIDLNGELTQYPLIAVKSNEVASYKVYPSVIENHLLFISITSEFSNALKLELINSTGQIVHAAGFTSTFSPREPLQLQLPISIIRGLYFLKLFDGRQEFNTKVIVKN